jgi:ribosomal protein L19E
MNKTHKQILEDLGSRLNDIKEALTKQDIRDLVSEGSILVAESHGRTKRYPRKTRRRAGTSRSHPRYQPHQQGG